LTRLKYLGMKISIIGSGHVGSTLAYTLVLRELATRLVLVDHSPQKAASDAADLTHALAFTEHIIPVSGGGIPDTRQSDIIIVTASIPWSGSFESRFDLGPGNVRLFRQLIPQLTNESPDATLIVVTNPLDIMTYFTLKFSGFSPAKVLGVGTLIDSARFRKILSEKYLVHPDDIRAYVLGEHGETQFPVLSQAFMGGQKLDDKKSDLTLLLETEKSAYEIVQGKGYTNFAISMATALIVESIAFDQNRTMPISTLLTNYFDIDDICLSVPVVVGKNGITRVLQPELDKNERKAFHRSATFVKSQIDRLKKDRNV